MASQIKPHTLEQMRGLKPFANKSECPECKNNSFSILESRRVSKGRRRRFSCDACGFRETRYEISGPDYERFLKLERAFMAFEKVMNFSAIENVREETKSIPCSECFFFDSSGCSFDIPEANTPDAVGCNNFKEAVLV
jgi:hypothetical protein